MDWGLMFKQIYFWQSRIHLSLSLPITPFSMVLPSRTMTFLSFLCAVFSITFANANAWMASHTHTMYTDGIGKNVCDANCIDAQAIDRINALRVQVKATFANDTSSSETERERAHTKDAWSLLYWYHRVRYRQNIRCASVCFAEYNIIKLRVCAFHSKYCCCCCCSCWCSAHSIVKQQSKIHKSSQIYTPAKCSQYTKQEEVKRGYGADVTLRDIKRRSILSSRRNIPPKKKRVFAGVKVYFFRCVWFVCPLSIVHFYFLSRSLARMVWAENNFFFAPPFVLFVQHFSDVSMTDVVDGVDERTSN